MADARSLMNSIPENDKEFGACSLTVAPLTILTFPTLPDPVFVVDRMIVTPLAPPQVEHLSTAFDSRLKSPSVIQYVPGNRSTDAPTLMGNSPQICEFAG